MTKLEVSAALAGILARDQAEATKHFWHELAADGFVWAMFSWSPKK